MEYVKSLDMFGVSAKEIPCVIGKGAPTKTTEGAVGVLYMEEDTGTIYKCISVAKGVYTWEVNGGSEEVAICSEPPEDANIKLWINPDEDGGGTSGEGANIDVVAKVGQTIRVKAIDDSGKPTEWEAVDLQPRTHWSEPGEVLPETTLEPDPELGMALLPDMAILAGDELTVVYNGTEYACTCIEMGQGMIGFGNIGAVDPEFATDTGEPFVGAKADTGDGTLVWCCIPLDGSASFTLSVIGLVNHPVPEKYLPHSSIDVTCTLSQGDSGNIVVTADIPAMDTYYYAGKPNTTVRVILPYAGGKVICNLVSVIDGVAIFQSHELRTKTLIYKDGNDTSAVRDIFCGSIYTVRAYSNGTYEYDRVNIQ